MCVLLQKIILILTIVMASSLFAQNTPRVSFEREVIRVFVDTNSVRVEGTYVLKNNVPSPLVQRLFYPFPADSLHPFPTGIAVIKDGDSVAFQRALKGIVFPIHIHANDSATFHVTYAQDCLDRSACYILTSTAVWQEPLKSAHFEVTVPHNIELTWIAYGAETVKEEKAARIHLFSRRDFMPDKDLCIKWQVKGSND
jgi:hypothetical protein